MQMLAYLSVEIVGLAFTCAKFEKRIYRAEAKNGCDQQDHAEHYQDNAKRACDDPTNIEIDKQNSDDGTDEAVNIGHIAFHIKISFGLNG